MRSCHLFRLRAFINERMYVSLTLLSYGYCFGSTDTLLNVDFFRVTRSWGARAVSVGLFDLGDAGDGIRWDARADVWATDLFLRFLCLLFILGSFFWYSTSLATSSLEQCVSPSLLSFTFYCFRSLFILKPVDYKFMVFSSALLSSFS